MENWGCLSPCPESPFIGMSIVQLSSQMTNLRDTTWAALEYDYNYYGGTRRHPCDLESKMKEIVRDAATKVKGLKLQELIFHAETL